jgi:hypothetical protein
VFCTSPEQLIQIGFDAKTASGLLHCIPRLQSSVSFELPKGGSYNGEIFRGVFHGSGTLEYKGGETYIGNWRYGLRDGFGTMIYHESGSDCSGLTWSKGDKYIGNFKRDLRHGACEYIWSSGQVLKCTWVDGTCDEWVQMNANINNGVLSVPSFCAVDDTGTRVSEMVSGMVQSVEMLLTSRKCTCEVRYFFDQSIFRNIQAISTHDL